MLVRVLVAAVIMIPAPAIALEEGEFHLYGINRAGLAFDITPHANRVGGPDKRQGLTSQFVMWVKPTEASALQPKPERVCTAEDSTRQCARWELMQRVGRCTVWLAPRYEVVCARDGLPLSGVTYAGEKLDASRARKVADAQKLYRSFLRRHDGAAPVLAAVYRCKDGCKDSLPATLIFLWLGD